MGNLETLSRFNTIFVNLSAPSPVLDKLSIANIERFVILFYDKTSVHTEVRGT